MSEIDDDKVKQWSLTLSDLISAKLNANISFKDFDSEEVLFNEFLAQQTEPLWTTLCEDADNQQPLIVTMNYTSIIATTNNFFSNSAKIYTENTHKLSVSEQFIANEISNDMLQAFERNEMNIRFLRNESQLSLIRPFHEDESMTIYKFNWAMNNDHYGELKLCHSHVL